MSQFYEPTVVRISTSTLGLSQLPYRGPLSTTIHSNPLANLWRSNGSPMDLQWRSSPTRRHDHMRIFPDSARADNVK